MVKMLEEFGCKTVDSAMNGQQAVKACREKSYDMVLCDYNLGPGKNGQQVLEELRMTQVLRPSALFFMVSAESSKSIVLSAYDLEPNAYLTKPITTKTLQQRLTRSLRQRQEMLAVYQALEAGDANQAIQLGQNLIASGSRSASACQKLIGNLMLEVGLLDDAEALYRKALEVRPLDWAKVGMARVKKAKGGNDVASQWLRKIIDESPFCMQAYDELVDSYQSLGDHQAEQQVLQSAVDISPMSILRQTRLANVAMDNNDFSISAKAFSRSVRLGQNSVHDSLDNYLQLGRATANLFQDDPTMASDLSREALRALDNAGKRFQLSSDQGAQSLLVECQVYMGRGDKKKASELMLELERELEENETQLSLDAELDRVKALQMMGKSGQVKALIAELLESYGGDQEALERIDRLLEEPVSQVNRAKVAAINSEGIGHYKNSQFSEAVACFKRAKQLFPNHIGIHLNLAQSLMGEMKEYGRSEELLELCLISMTKVESTIKSDHDQFNRFRQLQDMVRRLDREFKAN